MKFELGSEVKDKITGLKGILTGYSKYLTGCDQYLVQPVGKKSTERLTPYWIDEGRLLLTKKKVIDPKYVQSEKDGCDCEAPVK